MPLQINVPRTELWDEKNEEFLCVDSQIIEMEHSLFSISKWESIWKKPYYSDKEKTVEEIISYWKCMTLTENVNDNVYLCFNKDILMKIKDYTEDKKTATTIGKDNDTRSRRIITTELIYYWMVALNIPFECQYWHISRLITLIEVCNAENAPKKKMNEMDLMKRNAAINAARRARMKSRG